MYIAYFTHHDNHPPLCAPQVRRSEQSSPTIPFPTTWNPAHRYAPDVFSVTTYYISLLENCVHSSKCLCVHGFNSGTGSIAGSSAQSHCPTCHSRYLAYTISSSGKECQLRLFIVRICSNTYAAPDLL